MRGTLAALAIAAAGLSLAGCEAVGAGLMLFQSHEVEARHELAPGRVAVLAEVAGDATAPDPRAWAFGQQAAAAATGHLRANLKPLKRRKDGSPKRGVQLVRPTLVTQLRDGDPAAFAALPLDAVANKLGADALIYIELTSIRLPDARDRGMGGAIFTPTAAGSVRVVAADGERRFPRSDGPAGGGFLSGPGGEAFAVELGDRRVGEDAADPATLRRDLADAAGLAVARMFYDWTGPRPGDAVYEARRRAAGRPLPGDRR